MPNSTYDENKNNIHNTEKSIYDLDAHKQAYLEHAAGYTHRIVICAGTGCIANGSLAVYERFVTVIQEKGLSVSVSMKKETADYRINQSGCQGFCQMGPLITLYPEGIMYVKVAVEDVDEIVERTLLKGEHVERLLYKRPENGEPIHEMDRIPFYEQQKRMMLKLCGHIDVFDLDEYIANDGYFMARKAVLSMTPKAICDEILASGLRGRGGGGFPTGRKWHIARENPGDVKYVICNGDEGDPGAFMDRCVMEGNPHNVLEGMIIAAMAVNATEGFIYVRMEYPLAVERLHIAIKDARAAGFLGENIFGSNKTFDIQIMEGAGAFVCGEETALIASIEGKRGMPSLKPPYPAERGLFGRPTVINNVETLATVPIVLSMGAEAYKALGTETSTGTKTFALTGHVANTGLIEVEFGTTIRQIVNDIGGGVLNDDGSLAGATYKAVQIGGPSGGCLTMEHIDMPLDYEHLQSVGAMVGSGGLVVMNESTCMVKIARYFMQFTQNESCGKCVLCREGTRHMLALLDDIIEGRADEGTLTLLTELAETVQVGSLCMLGKTAPNPVLSTMHYFMDEYREHVFEKRCRTGSCDALLSYTIAEPLCKGCSLCARKCPVDAITGERGKPYHIDETKCIKCGACVEACKFKAIMKG